MSQTGSAMRATGFWLALASIVLAVALVFHGPPSPDLGEQMEHIADGSLRWSVVHWAAAAALSSFAIAGLIALTAGSRLTETWWALSAWAVVAVGALWTTSTAVAEATVIFNAAISGDRETFEAWWMFSEGRANGFGAMALAFTAIAANEARTPERTVPRWAASVALLAGAASFAGWVLGSWLAIGFGGPLWVLGSLVICVWLAWFGLSLMATGATPQGQAPPTA